MLGRREKARVVRSSIRSARAHHIVSYRVDVDVDVSASASAVVRLRREFDPGEWEVFALGIETNGRKGGMAVEIAGCLQDEFGGRHRGYHFELRLSTDCWP